MQKIFGVLFLLIFSSCASAPRVRQHSKMSPNEVLRKTCLIGSRIVQVKGDAWMKIKSEDKSSRNGQFPASIASQPNGNLRIEVTNPIGGTEAIIDWSDAEFSMKIRDRKPEVRKIGTGSAWSGVPLRFGRTLLMGRIVCPTADALAQGKTSWKEDLLFFESTEETFEYLYELGQPEFFPSQVVWTRKTSQGSVAVMFRLERPDSQTQSPMTWEAKSKGEELKFKWNSHSFKFQN
jgi:hypothetical protein